MLLRARIVLPVSQPPIENGAVAIDGDRIVGVGRWADMAGERGDLIDLGEVILMPGLINAHCHLDYTDMAGQIPPRKFFSDWIKAMVALKSEWSYTDYAQSWLHGAAMLLRTGTTTVLDVESVPELIPEIWSATPLRVVSFRELIGLKGGATAVEMVKEAVGDWSGLARVGRGENRLEACSTKQGVGRLEACPTIGLSPHAPYSTTPELLRLAAAAAREHHWPLTTHLAESEQEFEMFMHRRGALFEWLQSQRDMSDCGGVSPTQHLERCGFLGENFLAVHANYLEPEDVALLAKRKVSVVHCPRSHSYFGHRPFPYLELAAAGINVCLGTDSLVTVLKPSKKLLELNLFAEMRTLASKRPELTPSTLLRMATRGGAAALRRSGDLGELSPGALADLIVVPFSGATKGAEEGAVHFGGEVARVMIGGAWRRN